MEGEVWFRELGEWGNWRDWCWVVWLGGERRGGGNGEQVEGVREGMGRDLGENGGICT